MEINLKQNEIEAALRQYVASQGFNLTGRAISITFTSGRTPSGLTALVDIGDVAVVPPSTVGQANYRTLEARGSDLNVGTTTLQLQSEGVASGAAADVSPEPGNVAPEAGEVGESPATPAPEGGEAAPVTSLFAKPSH